MADIVDRHQNLPELQQNRVDISPLSPEARHQIAEWARRHNAKKLNIKKNPLWIGKRKGFNDRTGNAEYCR
jgi:hypothetical protein